MKTNKKNKHRGELLQAAIKQSDLTIKQVTARARYSRSSYYNHIDDPNLPVDILIRYGKVLKFDFSPYVPEVGKYQFYDDDSQPRLPPKTFDEAIEERDYWKDKYIRLLEKYNALLSNE